MRLGLGTGSTARALRRSARRKGRRRASTCLCVPTSEATAAQARGLGIPLTDLETTPRLDLTIDGADEIGPGLALIKGAGGALLREKIVAAASDRMVVIADASKRRRHARPLSAADRGQSVRARRHPRRWSEAVDGGRWAEGDGSKLRLRTRRRTLSSPMAGTSSSMLFLAAFRARSAVARLARHPGRGPARTVSRPVHSGLCRRAGRRESI